MHRKTQKKRPLTIIVHHILAHFHHMFHHISIIVHEIPSYSITCSIICPPYFHGFSITSPHFSWLQRGIRVALTHHHPPRPLRPLNVSAASDDADFHGLSQALTDRFLKFEPGKSTEVFQPVPMV